MIKKILILTNNDAGLYLFRKELIAAMINEGCELHISTPDTGYTESIKKLGTTVHDTGVDRRGTNPLKDIKLYRDYKRLISEVKPDAVLTYTIKPIVYGGMACKRVGVPVLANVTGLSSAMLHGSGLMGRFLTILYKKGLKGASYVFFQNEKNRELMLEKGCINKNSKVVLLPGSGVNLTEHGFVPYPEEGADKRVRFLYVGRIHDTKGSEELFEAARRLHEDCPEVVFDIAGECEEDSLEKYKPVMEELKKAGIATFHGFVKDVSPLYARCHALVHPTYFEGMSNVILEAAATGRPVIASNVPGCREIFEDGVGGIAFEPQNTDELLSALKKFLSLSYEEKCKMGTNAREYVEKHFDRNIVTDEYINALRSLSE
ncbi:MAG: glycosyltransferase family 4 protein [Lachnospiraceae bacterium]|nr:glycosyltransferase family 4 protein [Lachnospiraceae bacterium]